MARLFNAATDYVSVGTQALPTGDLVVSWWWYNTWAYNDGADHGAFDAQLDGTHFFRIQKWSDNQFYIGWYNSSGSDGRVKFAAGTWLTQNTWHHFVYIRNSATGCKVYIDGVERGSAGVGTTVTTNKTRYIGNSGSGTSGGNTGRIAEFAIWDSIPENIVAYLSAGGNPLKLGIVPVDYLPLWGLDNPEPNLIPGRTSGTCNNVDRADHPPVILFSQKHGDAPELGSSFVYHRSVRDTLSLSDSSFAGGLARITQELVAVDGTTGEARVTQARVEVDGATGEARITQVLAAVDGIFGTRRITQEVVYIDGEIGGRRISQTIAAIDASIGFRRISQLGLMVDVESWYLRPTDTLPLYDTVVSTRIVAVFDGTYRYQIADTLDVTDTIVSTYIQPPATINLIQITDALGLVDQLPARGPDGGPTRDGFLYESLDLQNADVPQMYHTIKWWQRLYIADTIVATRIVGEAPPTIPSTTYLQQVSDTLPLYDGYADWTNETKLRRVRDTLRLTDRVFRQRFAERRASDYLTLADSKNDLGSFFYYARAGGELGDCSEYLIDRAYNGELFGQLGLWGVAWRDFGMDGFVRGELSMPAPYRQVELTVTGIPDGWSARATLPDSTVAATALASMGRVVLELDTPGTITSGTLEIFQNPGATIPALFGMIPIGGPDILKRAHIWHYTPKAYALNDIMSSVYIERPWGGWTAPGSARIDREEIGYATFTDSALLGLSRGANGTVAAIHGSAPDWVACVKSGRGTLNITSFLSSTNSTHYRQDSIPIFVNSLDELLIGASSKFSAVHFWMALNASQRIMLRPYYSTGEGTWASWINSTLLQPLDTTSGFTWSGYAGLEPPGDWAPGTKWASGSATMINSILRYWFRLVRATGSSTLIPPRLMHVALTANAIITQRIPQPFMYYPTLQDSGQTLYFKIIARGIGGGIVPGASAPIAVLNL